MRNIGCRDGPIDPDTAEVGSIAKFFVSVTSPGLPPSIANRIGFKLWSGQAGIAGRRADAVEFPRISCAVEKCSSA